MNIIVKQRLANDYVTCLEWVGPTEANAQGRHPGRCCAVVPLRDGEVPQRCPFNHLLPWYGTELD